VAAAHIEELRIIGEEGEPEIRKKAAREAELLQGLWAKLPVEDLNILVTGTYFRIAYENTLLKEARNENDKGRGA
jgi:hypothetical protein